MMKQNNRIHLLRPGPRPICDSKKWRVLTWNENDVTCVICQQLIGPKEGDA